MDKAAIEAIFQRKSSRQEAKADAITSTVREMLNAETSRRDTKTERLKSARLARDAAMPLALAKATRGTGRRGK